MRSLLMTIGAAGLLATGAQAGNWPQWRGPYFNGTAWEQQLPVQWSTTENVAWVTPLPGRSGATPVIWEDSVFVSSPDVQKNLLLLCLDRKDGKVRWQKVVGTGDREKGRNNMASPSPVTDGKSVFVMFGTGALAAYDFSGRELWKRDLAKDYGHFSINWLYGSSPTLYRDKLYVQVLQQNPIPAGYSQARDDKPQRDSYLLCLDPATGQNLWRHIRATDATDEAMEAYSTPIPNLRPGVMEILVVGADYTTAHSAENGNELWRCGGLNDRKQASWRIVPSPLVAGEMIIACAPKRDPVLGLKGGGSGLVTATNIAWQFKEFPSDCVTPLFFQGKLFVLDGDRQVMTCLDRRTGEKKWQGNLGVKEIFRASPTGADGRIYCIGENGTAVVLDGGTEFKILATIPMGEAPVRSTIAVSQGQLFIRTAKNLYCIGKR
jgi:outer membrane protein assembly factor BamB